MYVYKCIYIFATVSLPLNWLYEIAIEQTLKNLCIAFIGKSRISNELASPVYQTYIKRNVKPSRVPIPTQFF